MVHKRCLRRAEFVLYGRNKKGTRKVRKFDYARCSRAPAARLLMQGATSCGSNCEPTSTEPNQHTQLLAVALTAHTSPSSKPRNMRRGWLGATTMLCCAVAVVIGANNALRLLAVLGRPVVSRRNPPRDVPAPAVRGRVRAVVRTPPLLDGFADCGRSGEGIDNGDRSMLTPLVATGGETDAPTTAGTATGLEPGVFRRYSAASRGTTIGDDWRTAEARVSDSAPPLEWGDRKTSSSGATV